VIVVTLPIKIVSEANLRQHWRKAAARKKLHRQTARLVLQQHARPMGETEQFTVTLTRVAPRKLDDDNLASGFKAVRDGIADWLGIDDGSPRIRWQYAQHKSEAGHYSAWVRVEWANDQQPALDLAGNP
jgi:hypothetical protein